VGEIADKTGISWEVSVGCEKGKSERKSHEIDKGRNSKRRSVAT